MVGVNAMSCLKKSWAQWIGARRALLRCLPLALSVAGLGLGVGGTALAGQEEAQLLSPASSGAACAGVPGLEPLLRGKDLLLLGEMHGTAESPAFADCAVHRALDAGRSVTAAIEVPLEEEPAVQGFLASAGSAADRDALLAGAFWQAAFQDGRRSEAMLQYLEDLRRLNRAGRRIHVLLLDSVGFTSGPGRD